MVVPDIYGLLLSISVVAYLFLLAGLALVIVEMFVPGFGAPGITGIALLIIGVILAVQGDPIKAIMLGIILLLILTVAFLIALFAMSRGALRKTPIINDTNLTAEQGFHSLDEVMAEVGSVGIVVTALRPVGVVEIDGKRMEASSEATFIEKGVQVSVARVDGRRMVVVPCEAIISM